MTKNIVIALLAGLLIGQFSSVRADSNAITKYDLIEAASLAGILANEHHDPLGAFGMFRLFRQPADFRQAAKDYAGALK